MGLVVLIFSQKEYFQESTKNSKKETKTFQVKTEKKIEELKKHNITKALEPKFKAKPMISSLVSPQTQILGKTFEGGQGTGAQINSSGSSFSEQISAQTHQKEEAAQIINFSQPKYPELARSKNIEGFIKVKLYISDLGKLQSFEILESEPKGIFEDSLKNALSEWTFKPAISKGKAVTGVLIRKIYFKMDQL